MKTSTLATINLVASACLLAAATPIAQAQGVTVYDSFDPGGKLDTTGFVVMADTPEYIGQIFTNGVSGNLDHALLGLVTQYGGLFTTGIELHTWTYTVGTYGYIDTTPLESWSVPVNTVLNPDLTGTPTTINSSVKPLLAAGQTYVIVAAITVDPGNEELLWCGAPYPRPNGTGGGYCYTYGGTNYFWTIGEVTLKVVVDPAPVAPTITGIKLSGNDLLLNGSNGVSGTTNYLLMTTNIALPKFQWTRIATNVLNASGNFSFTATNAVDLTAPQRFFILKQ